MKTTELVIGKGDKENKIGSKVLVCLCAYIKWKEVIKGENGKMGFFEKNHVLRKILIFYLLRKVMGGFGPGVEEQAGEEPLGERP